MYIRVDRFGNFFSSIHISTISLGISPFNHSRYNKTKLKTDNNSENETIFKNR